RPFPPLLLFLPKSRSCHPPHPFEQGGEPVELLGRRRAVPVLHRAKELAFLRREAIEPVGAGFDHALPRALNVMKSRCALRKLSLASPIFDTTSVNFCCVVFGKPFADAVGNRMDIAVVALEEAHQSALRGQDVAFAVARKQADDGLNLVGDWRESIGGHDAAMRWSNRDLVVKVAVLTLKHCENAPDIIGLQKD